MLDQYGRSPYSQAILAQLLAPGPAPRNIGEGLIDAGRSIGGALIANRAEEQARESQANDYQRLAEIMAGGNPIDPTVLGEINDPQIRDRLLAQALAPANTDLVEVYDEGSGQMVFAPKSQAAGRVSEAPEGPEQFTINSGSEVVTYLGNPSDRSTWQEVARGPRFNRNAGTNVSLTMPDNIDVGTIPPGFQLVRDGNALYMEPIPGGPAALEQEQTEEAEEAARNQRVNQASIVLEDIGRARNLAQGDSLIGTTGTTGALLSGVPGTGAHDLSQLLNTIKANVGFDKLQAMRAASPTGGALGQVSENENRLLQSVLGSLEQSQSQEQFLQNLDRLEQVYLDIIHGPGNRPAMASAGTAGLDDLLNKYAPQ